MSVFIAFPLMPVVFLNLLRYTLNQIQIIASKKMMETILTGLWSERSVHCYIFSIGRVVNGHYPGFFAARMLQPFVDLASS